ncbi:hypothetical protein [Endozoicomonas sp. SCSIO W0465]|uniref:hypothetical protein n=1 Tax=Endozoicomonas sp. SCSIO W0465 TaxID=2918516 RepID=UPI002075360C|nr:hypothetical protein [Endozoicomonas sp. SCSIO W0465]USE34535.1 hypothetical protein MJO57_20645 [Endozoicomonas sp. SCSIO W0465]
MRSNGGVYSPSEQGFILKATASTYSRPGPPGRGGLQTRQTGSSRLPDHPGSAFNGKRISSHQSHRVTAAATDNGKRFEDAFWEKNLLQGRQITPADVLAAYGNDRNSLRRGFFLQRLCLQNIPHGNRKITPDQVIQEFNRAPDRNSRCQLAIARFKEECCLKGLALNGERVTPDMVVQDFQAAKATLELARFTEQCCLRRLPLNGQQVTPDAVVKSFPNSPEGKLGLARFKVHCCLKSLPLNGRQVTPDEVVENFPESPEGKLGIARFKEHCCLNGLPLNGLQVTPDAVVKDYQAVRATLELARFKAECCLRGLLLNGQQVTPEAVVKSFPDSREGRLGIVRFKERCCLMDLTLKGQQVTPDEVVKDYQADRATLEVAHFKQQCFLNGCLNDPPLNSRQFTPDAVVKAFQAARAALEQARFKEHCYLRGLPLNGRQVTPDEVVKDFPESQEGKLGLARFKEKCCLRGLSLNDQKVTPVAVVKDYQAVKAPLELARFKAECCLRGLALDGQQVIPDAVVKDYQAARATLELARFKAACCLRGLVLNGQQVTPDAVVKDFPDSSEGKLGVARFKAECCLKGLALNGQQVTPDAVVNDYQAARITLELARFKQQCCLIGLPLNGQQVIPDAVVKDFPDSPEGKLGIARFKEQCCLRGLMLNGRQVTPDAVVKDFPDSPAGKLGRVRFKAECCLRGLKLNGQRVLPGAVVEDYQAARAIIELARFKEHCCLRGLLLNGQQVTTDAVVKDYQVARAGLDLVRFKEQCCLKGLPLNGRQVIPDAVVKDYERGGWLLEKAIFYSQLALNAKELNSGYLDNQKVLAAFNDVPGDHSSRQAEYLMQRLKQPQWYDETDDARDIIQQAWQILNNVSIKNDELRRLQCILKFIAMQYQLPIDHQSVSAEAVWQIITTLRNSFQNLRLQFFFLAQCYITNQSVDGRQIDKGQVMKCLQSFPEASNLRHALSRWFDQCSAEANIMDELLFKRDRDNVVPGRGNDRRNSHAVHSVNSVKEKAENTSVARAATVGWAQNLTRALKSALKIGTPFCPDQPVPQLHALTLKALEIIPEINGDYTVPPIVITGSYARFLQNRCSSFNDIDIICATEVAARTLFDKLRALNTDGDSAIPRRILILPMRGCQEIKLPNGYNIVLGEGDFGTKVMGLQVSVDARVIHGNAERLSVHVPGVEKPVCCLSFAEETRLLNDTLKYLADNLVLLTELLQKGRVPNIPRTIIFNFPNTMEERIYGLLIRSLLSLNKARQFIALYSEGKPDDQPDLLREQQQHLYALAEELQWKLRSHVYRDGFEQSVNRWLSTTQQVNDYEIKKKEFISVLLAMMRPETR